MSVKIKRDLLKYLENLDRLKEYLAFYGIKW